MFWEEKCAEKGVSNVVPEGLHWLGSGFAGAEGIRVSRFVSIFLSLRRKKNKGVSGSLPGEKQSTGLFHLIFRISISEKRKVDKFLVETCQLILCLFDTIDITFPMQK